MILALAMALVEEVVERRLGSGRGAPRGSAACTSSTRLGLALGHLDQVRSRTGSGPARSPGRVRAWPSPSRTRARSCRPSRSRVSPPSARCPDPSSRSWRWRRSPRPPRSAPSTASADSLASTRMWLTQVLLNSSGVRRSTGRWRRLRRPSRRQRRLQHGDLGRALDERVLVRLGELVEHLRVVREARRGHSALAMAEVVGRILMFACERPPGGPARARSARVRTRATNAAVEGARVAARSRHLDLAGLEGFDVVLVGPDRAELRRRARSADAVAVDGGGIGRDRAAARGGDDRARRARRRDEGASR